MSAARQSTYDVIIVGGGVMGIGAIQKRVVAIEDII
jgi:glycerol-3-phosphate dehydrogenase